MKILLAHRLSGALESLVVDDNVVYRPDLVAKPAHAIDAALLSVAPDVLVTETVPPEPVLSAWAERMDAAGRTAGGRRPVVIHRVEAASPPVESASAEIHRIDASSTSHLPRRASPDIDALVLAEELNARHLAPRAARRSSPRTGERVAVVGAGIVNLVTAHVLAAHGYGVDVYDAAPDPCANRDWRVHGSTFGGSDARIFSFDETRHHHHHQTELVGDGTTSTHFQRVVGDEGWLLRDPRHLGADDVAWIDEHERLPPWLAARFDRDIVSFNRDSSESWQKMRRECPDVFREGNVRDGVVRTYPSSAHFEAGRARERSIGGLVREIEPAALAAEIPALGEAVAAGSVAGALEVVGFSVNVHAFGRALVDRLRALGVVFHWNVRVDDVVRDGSGAFAALAAGGARIVSEHYVISTGAFGNELLRRVGAQQKNAGIVGLWAALPNLAPRLERAVKITRVGYASSAAAGANVIPGKDDRGREVIHISAGHGFVGTRARRLERDDLSALARALDDVARTFFPARYAQAVEDETYEASRRHCVRPWTPSGLGSFEIVEHAGGRRTIVTGGNSTGGFAQSPSIAQAVLDALAGRAHPMHALYHPLRFADFIGA